MLSGAVDPDDSGPPRLRQLPAWRLDAEPKPTSVNAQSRSTTKSDHMAALPLLKKRKTSVVTQAADTEAQATLEGLTLMRCSHKSGFLYGNFSRGRWQATSWRDGKSFFLGRFGTAEEAALAVARSPEGMAESKARYMSTEQAISQADAEGLTLVRSKVASGFADVYYRKAGYCCFTSLSLHTGKQTDTGLSCCTAEHAALYAARFRATVEGKEFAAEKKAKAEVPTHLNTTHTHTHARTQTITHPLTCMHACSRPHVLSCRLQLPALRRPPTPPPTPRRRRPRKRRR